MPTHFRTIVVMYTQRHIHPCDVNHEHDLFCLSIGGLDFPTFFCNSVCIQMDGLFRHWIRTLKKLYFILLCRCPTIADAKNSSVGSSIGIIIFNCSRLYYTVERLTFARGTFLCVSHYVYNSPLPGLYSKADKITCHRYLQKHTNLMPCPVRCKKREHVPTFVWKLMPYV